jgi:hypothetical protein
MFSNITLSNGRTVIHTKEPNGSTLATPTPGDYAFTKDESKEYHQITANLKVTGAKVPAVINHWSN